MKAVLEGLLGEGAVPEAAYLEVMKVHRPALQRAFTDYFAGNNLDAYVVPTTALPARPIGEDETVDLNGACVPTFPAFIRNSDPISCAGLPGLSLPAGATRSGLPVGIEFCGSAGADCRLLEIAAAFEAAMPGLPAPTLPGHGS